MRARTVYAVRENLVAERIVKTNRASNSNHTHRGRNGCEYGLTVSRLDNCAHRCAGERNLIKDILGHVAEIPQMAQIHKPGLPAVHQPPNFAGGTMNSELGWFGKVAVRRTKWI